MFCDKHACEKNIKKQVKYITIHIYVHIYIIKCDRAGQNSQSCRSTAVYRLHLESTQRQHAHIIANIQNESI